MHIDLTICDRCEQETRIDTERNTTTGATLDITRVELKTLTEAAAIEPTCSADLCRTCRKRLREVFADFARRQPKARSHHDR